MANLNTISVVIPSKLPEGKHLFVKIPECTSESSCVRVALEMVANKDHQLDGAKLNSRDLRNANLEGAKLTWCRMNGVDLSGSNLQGAQLNVCRFLDAQFVKADISDADFTKSDLNKACLREANAANANFSKAHLEYADFTGANLSGADLRDAHLDGVIFTGANITGTKMSKTARASALLGGAIIDQLAPKVKAKASKVEEIAMSKSTRPALSYEALNDILESSAYSGHSISKKTYNELVRLSGKELEDVQRLYDEYQREADEEIALPIRG